MKKLNLNELNKAELEDINGGLIDIIWYTAQPYIAREVGKMYCEIGKGIRAGFNRK